METNEAVDDLQVEFDSGKRATFQAKRTIGFSVLSDSELVSVFKQFVTHELAAEADSDQEYYLVTSSMASKRVTGDMLAALVAARGCTPAVFRRDQPKAIVETYDALFAASLLIQSQLCGDPDESWVRTLLSKCHVIVLDVDPNSSLEQALVLSLHAKGYAAPEEMWGKLVTECLEWARRRLTVDLADIDKRFRHLMSPPAASKVTRPHQYLRVELKSHSFEVGRELVIARALNDQSFLPSNVVGALEFYRFDGDCRPRLKFSDDRIVLGNGHELELWGRFATWTGLYRFIDENIDRFKDEEVAIYPMNVDRDLENDLCAKTHRAALDAAALSRDATKCVHCDLPVTSSMSPVVEFGDGPTLCFGLSHSQCVRPTDRILGRADSEMFSENPELVNFDINAWFNAAHRGHGVFGGINASKQSIAPVVWGGIPPHEDAVGKFVVVSILADGSEQMTSNRGRVQRFTQKHAEEWALQLRQSVQAAEEAGDPLCYSDQSRAYSTRSTLIKQLGSSEKIERIAKVIVRPYEASEAARYPGPDHWYAPLMILREAETLTPLVLTNAIPAISNPLALGRHLENWRKAGFSIPAYEIESLLTDAQIDQLIDTAAGQGLGVILDPLVSEDGSAELVHGHPIYPLGAIEQLAQTQTAEASK